STGTRHRTDRTPPGAPYPIHYQTTLDDPPAWTRPWTALVHWARSSQPTYEVACHEGNYAITGILSGARATEKRCPVRRRRRAVTHGARGTVARRPARDSG